MSVELSTLFIKILKFSPKSVDIYSRGLYYAGDTKS